MAANPTRGQLNWEKRFFPRPRWRLRFGLARQIRPSHSVSACSFSTLRFNLVLTHGTPSAFRDGVIVHIYRQTPSGQSRVYRVMQLRADGVNCRESTGPGTVVLKVVRATDAAFSGFIVDHFICAPLFLT